MDAFQIILLVLGVAIFVVSFFLPGGKKEGTGNLKNEERRIREMLDEEMKNRLSQMSVKADELMDEKSSDALEKTERGLERVSNEKMMAVSEYADTVLSDINKNHDEVVFLYSMLGDKQKELKDDLAAIDKGNKETKKQVKELDDKIKELNDKIKESEEAKLVLEEALKKQEEDRLSALEMIREMEVKPEPKADADNESAVLDEELMEVLESYSEKKADKKKAAPERKADKKVESEKAKEAKRSSRENADQAEETEAEKKRVIRRKTAKMPEISSISGANSNEMILKLYKEGKSNVAIAKELGLGVGEVKLVIDLYKQS